MRQLLKDPIVILCLAYLVVVALGMILLIGVLAFPAAVMGIPPCAVRINAREAERVRRRGFRLSPLSSR